MPSNTLQTKRIPSIDRFRGLVIFCMIMFQFVEHFKNLGVWATISHHAPNENAIYFLPNFSIADIVAPMFILAIGLTYVPSLNRRIEKYGTKDAIILFVKRYLTLIGIGIAMNGINDVLDGPETVLEKVVVVLTIIVLVLGLIALILKIAKVKPRAKFNNVYSLYMSALGLFGIAIAAFNAFCFVTGRTSSSLDHWLVLHHIGFAGLVALPFALIKGKKGDTIRLIAGVTILALFSIFHEGNLSNDLFDSNRQLIDETADGGFIGGFAWGAMLLIYLYFAEKFRERKNKNLPPVSFGIFAVIVAVLLVAIFKTLPEGTTYSTWAGALSDFLPINKGSVSPSYVIIASFISLFIFYIFELFNSFTLKGDVLAWWGKNPILMYCVEFAVIGGLNAACEDYFEVASVPVSIIIIVVTGCALTALAYILDKKKIIIKL